MQTSSVFEAASISNEDGDREIDGGIADLIENLSGAIRGDIRAACHHNETEYGGGDHQSEALRTAPDVEDLSIRKLPQASDQARDDTSRGGQGVSLEGAGHVGSQSSCEYDSASVYSPLFTTIDIPVIPDPKPWMKLMTQMMM